MTDFGIHNQDSRSARSKIACHVCRKRKIKCGRELPHCLLCQQSHQTCIYPDKILRPGPKIGSTQAPRKRTRRGTPDDSDKEQQPQQRRRSSSSVQRGLFQPCKAVSSAQPSPGSQSSERRTSNIQSLSFILHPSHESCSPEKVNEETAINKQNHGQSPVTSACYFLGLNSENLKNLINKFFDTYTSFRLFRQSDFHIMLSQIETVTQCKALLAAMMLFVTKAQNDVVVDSSFIDLLAETSTTSKALTYVDEAIHECEDAPIPLPLLQALILITHWLLIQGVRGRAWRYLGLAVRIAYELNLHLIDADASDDGVVDAKKWCEDEERRRAWWAIWEMDVFASVIRRCPTAINWSQNETFLLADDEKWSRGEPQASCCLKADAIDRFKALEKSGNRSWKAWFIVINSLMRDAQKITSPFSVDKPAANLNQNYPVNSTRLSELTQEAYQQMQCVKESLNHLCTIQNALQCTTMALPTALGYRGQTLSFGSNELDRQYAAVLRDRHSAIYSIHVMVQLTKLMLYKYHLFRTEIDNLSKCDMSSQNNNIETSHSAELQALQEYTEASNEIVSLIGRSHEDHYKCVNPLLANTIWLAGAVQLLYRELASLEASEKSLTNSKVEILSMTYRRFVNHWSMSTTMQKNLELVESEIQNLKFEARRAEPSHCTANANANKRPAAARRRSSKRDKSEPQLEVVSVDEPGTSGAAQDSGFSELTHTTSANGLVSPASFNSEVAIQEYNENGEGACPIWPPMTNRQANHHGDLTSFDTAAFDVINQQSTQNQDIPYPRNCGNEALFLDVNSTVQQVPHALRSMSTSNGLHQPDSQFQLFSGGHAATGLSPEFLAGVSFGSKHCFSNYLDGMLSGGYAA